SAFIPMAGSNRGVPCLTAGRAGSRGPIHGCSRGPHAAPGGGALLLTRTRDFQASGVVMRRSFPTSRGLNLSFTAYSWGGIGSYMGRGGDGISVMLLVAPAATRIGPTGSSLGYDLQPPALDPNSGTTFPGINAGYLGIGLDAFGNWTDANGDAANCTTPPW